jgi:hypothetical protein
MRELQLLCLEIGCALSQSFTERVLQRFGGFFHWVAELQTVAAWLPPYTCRPPKLFEI